MLPNLLAQQSTNPTSDAVESEMTKISNHARRAIGVPNGIGWVPVSFPLATLLRLSLAHPDPFDSGRWRTREISDPSVIWPAAQVLEQSTQQFERTVLSK